MSLGKGRAEWGSEEGWVRSSRQGSGKRRGFIVLFLWGLESDS